MVISRIVKPKIQSRKALYTWGGPTAPHAPQVFFGYTSKTGLNIPGRDWVNVAVTNFDFIGQFNSTRSINDAFDLTANLFSVELTEAIEGDFYQWPRLTIRRSGELAGSPRNIVDLGRLRDSQSLELK